MKTPHNINGNEGRIIKPIAADFFEHVWQESWTYIKTVVDVLREPVLILDKDFRVMVANEPFYQTFQAERKDTEGEVVYNLGNGQWDIPALRKLLEDILPKNTFFKGFEVVHEFPFIGKKTMILNARQIHFNGDVSGERFPPIILLAMEDVTDMMVLAETVANHAQKLRDQLTVRIDLLESSIGNMQKEIANHKDSVMVRSVERPHK